MSLNLHYSLSKDTYDEFGLVQINQDDSESIYGDGIHEHIVERLRTYYYKMEKRYVEYLAHKKGNFYPFTGKDKDYWFAELETCMEKREKELFSKLQALNKDQIEWSIW